MTTTITGATGIDNIQAATGAVLQVVSSPVTTAYAMTSTGFINIGSLAITPKNASSKILVTTTNHVYVNSWVTNGWRGAKFRLLRGTTVLYGDVGADPYGEGAWVEHDQERWMTYNTHHYMDSPNTTATVTYNLEYAIREAGQEIQINQSAYGSQGSVTLMEIAG
jgi:hypothetical protein